MKLRIHELSARRVFLYKKKLCGLFCLVVIISGCNQSDDKEFPISPQQYLGSIEEELLIGEIVLDGTPNFTAFDLVATEDYLVVCNGIPNPYYYDLIDIESNNVVSSLISQGKGPNEFSGVLQTNSFKSNSIIVSSIEMGRKLYLIDLDSAIVNPEGYNSGETGEYDQYGVFKPAAISEDLFALVTLNDSTRYTFINRNGEIVNKFKSYPFLSELDNINKEVYGLIFQSVVVSNLEMKRVALFDYNSFNWHILNVESPLSPKVVFENNYNLPEFRDFSTVSEDYTNYSIAFSSENEKTFLDATCNKDYIYVLYSGKSIERHDFDSNYSNMLLQLDWDGNLLRKYRLDKQTQIIAITDKNILYSIVEEEEKNKMISYKIPTL